MLHQIVSKWEPGRKYETSDINSKDFVLLKTLWGMSSKWVLFQTFHIFRHFICLWWGNWNFSFMSQSNINHTARSSYMQQSLSNIRTVLTVGFIRNSTKMGTLKSSGADPPLEVIRVRLAKEQWNATSDCFGLLPKP